MESAKPKPAVTQPPWQSPKSSTAEPKLMVYNSLTKTKTEFITKKPGIVSWYNCGPTVYDASHMGHARNYMTQDIMRRILRDYFGYELHFVTNITDVDDKIILRARQSHLFSQYYSATLASSIPLSPTLLSDVKEAWSTYLFKALGDSLTAPAPSQSFEAALASWTELLEKTKNPKWLEEQKMRDEKWSMAVEALRSGLKSIDLATSQACESRNGAAEATILLEANRDPMSVLLDRRLGSTVTDHVIFRNLAAHWEKSYFKSMRALRVEDPTTLTRVSEYIPEIVQFTAGIIDRGLGYEEGGSVYFNTTKFEGSEGSNGPDGWKHTYAKLQPWSKGNRELLEDGEGSLSSALTKRSAADFALWKSSKPGEPSWPSPWGLGRPGWHIECSVMASAVLGDGLDVHSGGVDLAFPHHDNEIAQSEAYHNCRQWVNYFLHTGHLHIEGLKMSKSLKNFITIDDALTRYTARQLRLSFLSTTWHAKLDFKDSSMQEVRIAESVLNNFFANMRALIAERELTFGCSDGHHHYNDEEQELLNRLESAQLNFRAALSDSFDTTKALQIIFDLVSTANVYLGRGRSAVNVEAVSALEEWITRMLRMLGLGEGSTIAPNGEKMIGWGTLATAGDSNVDKDTILMPYMRALSKFRDNVRRLAISGASAAELLALSDELRDTDLVDLGVAVDDQEDGQARVKFVAPEVLRQARDAKEKIAAEKLARRAEAKAAEEVKRLEKLERGKVSPTEMFKKSSEYSAWDEQGLPTVDKDGVEVAKSKRKKLQKEWEVQKKLFDAYSQAVAASVVE